MNDAQHQLQKGHVLAGRYRIDRTLGQGGFGITYQGEHMNLGRAVAIKEYYPISMAHRYATMSADVQVSVGQTENYAAMKERFLREGRLLASCLKLRTVVDVLDLSDGRDAAHRRGQDVRR